MLVVLTSQELIAQTEVKPESKRKEFANSNQFTLLSGLIQPLILAGVNFAGTYYTKRLTFEYSHGMGCISKIHGK